MAGAAGEPSHHTLYIRKRLPFPSKPQLSEINILNLHIAVATLKQNCLFGFFFNLRLLCELKLQLIVTKSTERITQGLYGCWVKLNLVCSGAVCLGCWGLQENCPEGWGLRGLQWLFPLWILQRLIKAEHTLQPFVQLRLLI